jgi:sulfane dehydrogenase subunit SoxC
MNEKEPGRRRFIKKGLVLAGVAAAGGAGIARAQTAESGAAATTAKDLEAYGERSHYVTSVRLFPPPFNPNPFGLTEHLYTPIQDSIGIITPSSLHYTMGHVPFYVPDINPEQHRLMIHGMVDRPLVLTMADLKRFPSVTRVHYLECNGNKPMPQYKTLQRASGLTSCSEWTGVPLSLLLKQAGVHNGAKWILAEGTEDNKGTMSLPMAKAMADMLVAYGQNGEPVRPQNGFPLRLLVPGYEGLCNVKWLRRIKVVDEFHMTYNEMDRYTSVNPKTVKPIPFEQGPKSVITFPSGEQQLPERGHYQITGLAWSGGGAIRKVEVSTDGGKTWKGADIQSAIHRIAHTRFGIDWNWDGQECVLMSRCTDELGQIQPTAAEFARFFNWTTDYLFSHPGTLTGHNNYILPWKVGRDGKVQNGLA